MVNFSAELLDHFDYPDLDEKLCPCTLCLKMRALNAYLAEAVTATSEHKGMCACDECKERGKRARAALAWSNRRDTYSEMSFLVQDKTWRTSLLRWLFAEVTKPRADPSLTGRSDHWWIYEAEQKSLAEWIEDWLETLPNARRISGARALSAIAIMNH
jgi:hypothetical protein